MALLKISLRKKRGKMTHPWFYCNTHLNALLYKLVHIHTERHPQADNRVQICIATMRYHQSACASHKDRGLHSKYIQRKQLQSAFSRQGYMLFDFRLIFYFAHSFCISSLFYPKTSKVWVYVSLQTSKTISITLSTYTLLPIKRHKRKQSILVGFFSLMHVLGLECFLLVDAIS